MVSMESDTLFGKFMVILVWRLSGALCMEKTWQIRTPDYLHINFTTKSVSILSSYYLHIFHLWRQHNFSSECRTFLRYDRAGVTFFLFGCGTAGRKGIVGTLMKGLGPTQENSGD